MVFNRLFGKRKKADFEDSLNLSLRHLKKGCFLDYFMKTWEVKECYEYDWGNNFFSHEYLIDSGEEKKYVHVEEDGELKITISEEIDIMAIDKELKADIIREDKPPGKIIYKGKTYYLSNENQGYFRNMDSEDWSEFVSWEFVDDGQNNFIGVARWGETDFSADIGMYAKEYEFSNFIPSTE